MLLKLYDFLFARTCIFCHASLDTAQDMCPACLTDLQKLHLGEYEYLLAMFIYKPPIANLLRALKFAKKLVYARVLGELFAEFLDGYYQHRTKPEVIIPMPLHRKRLKQRGFNQAVELAKPIATKLQIPLDVLSCERIKNTKPQTTLKAAERSYNVQDAFTCCRHYQHVAILDDVITTGSTVQALGAALRKQHVKYIEVWCLAKTLEFYK